MKKEFKDIEVALNEITRSLQESQNEISEEFIETLAKALDCEWVTYWKLDAKLTKLLPALFWCISSTPPTQLEIDTHARTFSLSEGMPGHIWKSKRAFLTNDLEMKMCLPRSLHAYNVGLKSGIWIPVATESNFYGVIELLSKNVQLINSDQLKVLEKFGFELGSLQS